MKRRRIVPRVGNQVFVDLGARRFWGRVTEVRHLGPHTFISVVPDVSEPDIEGGMPEPYIVTPDSIREKRPSRNALARA